MRKLDKPTDNARQVFRDCISIVDNDNLKTRLESVELNVEVAAIAFDNAATTATLHTIPRIDNVAGVVTKNEMVDVYDYRMVREKTPGRLIYDKLRALPKHGICPLCGQRVVSTLDHHLPKTKYPVLAVVPVNLVPSCKDCNTGKLSEYPFISEEQTLHPYYDNIEDVRWLSAVVFEGTPAALRFFILPPPGVDPLLATRVRFHFKAYKLAALYAAHAASEIVSIRLRLGRLFDSGGAEAVKRHLLEEAESREEEHLNSWQSATYRALASNDWFCAGGFR